MFSPARPPQDNPKTLNTQLYIQLYEKKLARFRQFAALYPECYWLFVGDNGQVWGWGALGQQATCKPMEYMVACHSLLPRSAASGLTGHCYASMSNACVHVHASSAGAAVPSCWPTRQLLVLGEL